MAETSGQAGKWRMLEAWLEEVFAGLERKSGGPMVVHSVRVGRALRTAGHDELTVFGGYCHDVLEDTRATAAELHAVAASLLADPRDAHRAVALVVECSYAAHEEALPWKARKDAASARWAATRDPRVAHVKLADIDDNRGDAEAVSARFARSYRGWADPLYEALLRNLKDRPLS
jgi:(p)ppGpp synthase/HD superfamily hydrolase